MSSVPVKVLNAGGKFRVVVTRNLPGDQWQRLLVSANCRVEISEVDDRILSCAEISSLIGDRCDAVIGQLTESWNLELFQKLKSAGGRAYSNYAVGYNNVDVAAATSCGIPVGNTPGVLTDTTAEMAIALTFAAGRRITEGQAMMLAEAYTGWSPTLLLGKLFHRKTVGVVGLGRIGEAYATMLVEGCKMNVVCFDPFLKDRRFAGRVAKFAEYLKEVEPAQPAPTFLQVRSLEEFLPICDVISLHCNLTPETKHLIGAKELAMCKKDAILINTSRGPVIDENALVSHLRANPDFRVGLDVYEEEPAMAPGLKDMPNAVLAPHIASATVWTRGAMAAIAAANIRGLLLGSPMYDGSAFATFADDASPPEVVPSCVNATELGLKK